MLSRDQRRCTPRRHPRKAYGTMKIVKIMKFENRPSCLHGALMNAEGCVQRLTLLGTMKHMKFMKILHGPS